MDLGSTIYRLRTAKNLSQEDLAERLEVSRQSVSKWENNTATPDLEKLVKLCDIFEISLDELAGRSKPEPKEILVASPAKNPALTQRKIVGYILLGLSIVAALLFLFLRDLFYEGVWVWFQPIVLPLFCCGLVCLSDRNHVGNRCFWLACLWASGFLLENLVWFSFRLFGPVRLPLFFLVYHLIMILVGVFAARFLLTGVKVSYQKKRWYFLLPGGLLFLILCWFSPKLIHSRMISDALGYNAPIYLQYAVCAILTVVLSILVTAAYLHLRSWRDEKKHNS